MPTALHERPALAEVLQSEDCHLDVSSKAANIAYIADTVAFPCSPSCKRQRLVSSDRPPAPRLKWSALVERPEEFAELLERHHYVILTSIPASVRTACETAAALMTEFFETSRPAAKRALVSRRQSKRCGYRVTSQAEGLSERCHREAFHILGDAGSAQPWPSRSTAVAAARCTHALEAVAHHCLAAALRGARMPSARQLREMDLGPSVLDAFHYLGSPATADFGRVHGDMAGATDFTRSGLFELSASHNGNCSEEEVLMHEHLDPGFLTLEPRASAAGLQVLEGQVGEWRMIEPELGPGDIVVLACEALQRITNGAIQGSLHRVVSVGGQPRHSLAYELRGLDPSAFAIGSERLRRADLGEALDV
mmetsp:Transcript_69246/g.225556  ORF Transcript_69246/g.225556 Transcript_69246/m.225556 type:complete len:366 (+) Transcript_69246:159-1256(+)